MFFILFVVWIVAELFVIVKVAEAIGVLLTIVLLIAAWPLGGWAMRSEGRVVWRRFNAAIAEGRAPGREVVDGALVVLGGGLLMVPGFISDVVGLLLLFPPTRVVLRAGLVRNFQHRLVAQAGRFAGPFGRGRAVGRRRHRYRDRPSSAPAVSNSAETRSFAFGEPDGALVGTATVWDGGFCSSFGAPLRVEGTDPDEEWRLAGDGFELTFAPMGEVAELELADAGIRSLHQLTRVRGTMVTDGGEQEVDCPGQRGRRLGALDPKRFAGLRAVSAWFGDEDGLAVIAARPRKARGHDTEILDGVLLEGGVALRVLEPRLSSTSTADGATARVGLELWLGDPEEDAEQYARRAAGESMGRAAACDDPLTSSELLHWRMRGREGIGVYDLLRTR